MEQPSEGKVPQYREKSEESCKISWSNGKPVLGEGRWQAFRKTAPFRPLQSVLARYYGLG